jgi:protease I
MKKVAILIDEEFEDSEFAYPSEHLKAAGYDIDVIADEKRTYRGKHGMETSSDLALADAAVHDYDALYIPGGHAPEKLCAIPEVVTFARALAAENKPICAVCHGPLLLAQAGLLRGRTVTGYKSTKEALMQAGGNYTGESVERDGMLITARDPRSLPEMTQLFIELLSAKC